LTDGALPGQTSSGFSDSFLRGYDASGTAIWTRQFGTASIDQAFGVAVDGPGNVYVAGLAYGALPGQTSSGFGDAYLRRYDASGAVIWTRQFGTPNHDYALGVAVDGPGNVYVSGYTDGTLPGQTASGGGDAFALKWSQRSCVATANPETQEAGPVSGPIHLVDPLLPAEVHRLNCEVIVPQGL
ncbi:MAG: SBBP repeat-containing protein, partial [Actinomycetota bacterium]